MMSSSMKSGPQSGRPTDKGHSSSSHLEPLEEVTTQPPVPRSWRSTLAESTPVRICLELIITAALGRKFWSLMMALDRSFLLIFFSSNLAFYFCEGSNAARMLRMMKACSSWAFNTTFIPRAFATNNYGMLVLVVWAIVSAAASHWSSSPVTGYQHCACMLLGGLCGCLGTWASNLPSLMAEQACGWAMILLACICVLSVEAWSQARTVPAEPGEHGKEKASHQMLSDGEVAFNKAAFDGQVNHLLETVHITHWDKKPWMEMTDAELMALKHIIFEGYPSERRRLPEMFHVSFTLPYADPDMLPPDAAKSLKAGFEATHPHLKVLGVTFHRGSLLVAMKLSEAKPGAAAAGMHADESHAGAADHGADRLAAVKEDILSLWASRSWLAWLALPLETSSGFSVVSGLDTHGSLTGCLPDVVLVDRPCPQTGTACVLLPFETRLQPKDILVRVAVGQQSMATHIKPSPTVGRPGKALFQVQVEGISMQQLGRTCRLMTISTYDPSSRDAKSSHDIILLPPGCGAEERECLRLCDPSAQPAAGYKTARPSGHSLALSWACWLEKWHTLQLESVCKELHVSESAAAAAAPGLGAFMGQGAMILMELIQSDCLAMVDMMLQVLIKMQGIWALNQHQTKNTMGYNLLHHAVLSGSKSTVDTVITWIDQYQLNCSWDSTDSKGFTPMHLAAMLDPRSGIVQHLLSKQDPNILSVWLAAGANGTSPKHMAERIGLVHHMHRRSESARQGSRTRQQTVVMTGRQIISTLAKSVTKSQVQHSARRSRPDAPTASSAVVKPTGHADGSLTQPIARHKMANGSSTDNPDGLLGHFPYASASSSTTLCSPQPQPFLLPQSPYTPASSQIPLAAAQPQVYMIPQSTYASTSSPTTFASAQPQAYLLPLSPYASVSSQMNTHAFMWPQSPYASASSQTASEAVPPQAFSWKHLGWQFVCPELEAEFQCRRWPAMSRIIQICFEMTLLLTVGYRFWATLDTILRTLTSATLLCLLVSFFNRTSTMRATTEIVRDVAAWFFMSRHVSMSHNVAVPFTRLLIVFVPALQQWQDGCTSATRQNQAILCGCLLACLTELLSEGSMPFSSLAWIWLNAFLGCVGVSWSEYHVRKRFSLQAHIIASKRRVSSA